MSPAMHRGLPAGGSSSDLSRSPIRNHPPPRRDRRRRSPGVRSPVRGCYSQRTRSPTREDLTQCARSPRRKRSRSPVKEKMINHAREPRHGSSSKGVRLGSPVKEKVPDRHIQSRSPLKWKSSEYVRSPRKLHSNSPIRSGASRSPSPGTQRLRRAQVEREAKKSSHMEEEKISSREDRRRNIEREDDKDVSKKRKSAYDKSDGGTSRLSRHIRVRSISPAEPTHRARDNSQSSPRASKASARDEASRTRGAEQLRVEGRDSISKMKAAEEALEEKQKQKPSFELSGKLAEETNQVRGVTLLFTEPPDAYKPDIRWRFYIFKASEVLNEPLHVHRQSCYLFGRERRLADIPTDHPSCSKQHAVLQFRHVEKEQSDGLSSKQPRIRSLAREFREIKSGIVMHQYLRFPFRHSNPSDSRHRGGEAQLSCASCFWLMKTVGPEPPLIHIWGLHLLSFLSRTIGDQTLLCMVTEALDKRLLMEKVNFCPVYY